jgi:uncharacterized membrane protein YdbT with pleckstrin-like domain
MNFRSLFPSQRPNESIYVFVRPYFLAFLPWIVIGLGLLLAAIIFVVLILAGFPDLLADVFARNVFVIITSAFLLLLVPFMTVAFLDFYYDLHIVTDRRLVDIDQNKLFSREINELALEEVQDVTTQNSGIFSSVFDFGHVLIETAGSQQKFEFNNVLHPREIASIILDLSDQAKQRIEGSEDDRLTPRVAEKGVINGQVFTSLAPLEEMGAVVTPEGTRPATEKTNDSNDDAAPPEDIDIVIDDPSKK